MALAAAALVFTAVLFGGGGAEAPLNNAVLNGLAAVLLCACVASHFATRPLPKEAALPLWMAVAALLVATAQLIPLPAPWWSGLAGRDTAVAVAALIGESRAMRPLSLDPEATRAAASALLLPVAILLATLQSSARGVLLIVRALVAAALLSALLAAVQVSLGTPAWLAPYGKPEPGIASGVFANANHQAQLMLAALLATGLLIRLGRPQIKLRGARGTLMLNLEWVLFPIFILFAVVTYSRAGIALLLPAAAAAALIATGRRGTARMVALGGALLAALGASYALLPVLVTNSMRLNAIMGENRFVSLADIFYTLGQYWPWGSGLGTFVPVYKANEDLHLLQKYYVNHAHNDIAELLIETGLPGALLLGLAAILVVARLWRLLARRRTKNLAPPLAGFVMLVLLLLHSLVDYPLRMSALAAVAAVAMGLLFLPLRRDWAAELDTESPQPRRRGFSARFRGGR